MNSQLNHQEKKLVFILIFLLILFLQILFFRFFFQKIGSLKSSIRTQEIEILRKREIIHQSIIVKPYIKWLQQHPIPKCSTEENASVYLLQKIDLLATKNFLQVTETKLLPVHNNCLGKTVSISTNLSGNFKAIMKFLFEIQTTTVWIVINNINLTKEDNSDKCTANLELKQLFQLAESNPHNSVN